MTPEQLLFTDTHEWVHVSELDGAKVVTLGISAFAVELLTDLVYLELPEVGRRVGAREEIGEVESVKAVSPIYSPVAGEIIAVNTDLPDHLESLSQSPYEGGWIAKIRVTDDASLAGLLDYSAYQKQCDAAG